MRLLEISRVISCRPAANADRTHAWFHKNVAIVCPGRFEMHPRIMECIRMGVPVYGTMLNLTSSGWIQTSNHINSL